ncbi:MAG TPA: mechanosensitive ion channel domain-containing protein, partial [Terracidiphilus sp.]
GPWVQLVGPDHGLEIGGVKLFGFNAINVHKLLLTVVLLGALYLLSKLLRAIARAIGGARQRTAFWTRQGVSLTTFVVGVAGFVSIWFDNPARLATGAGLIGAALAFALQKVVTNLAGYFVIRRGNTFSVGDRTKMGTVRGDVIELNFIQTVIMGWASHPASRKKTLACGCGDVSTPEE